MGGMRKLVLASLFALHTAVAPAQEFTSPMDLLETLYDAYLTGALSDLSPYLSNRLTAEMGPSARLSPGIVASMGVDPLIGATNADITLLSITPMGTEARRATVEVRFHNRKVPVELTFDLVEETDHGWQIDHLEGRSGDIEWCSNALVEASRSERRR